MAWVVVGASGFVGSAVAAELAGRGIPARGVRAPHIASSAADPAAIVREASCSPLRQLLAADFAGAEVVINAAGLAAPGHTGSPELTGANALLPVLVAIAAKDAGVSRVIHLSSAAVQGHRPVLDESAERTPFSAYSRSKALAEEALAALPESGLELVVLRATSVQGPERPTTVALRRLAASALASVAAPGTAPTPVSSIHALAWFVAEVGLHAGRVPAVVLQPWEGLSVTAVLAAAGGRQPRTLPAGVCRLLVRTGYLVSRLLGERLHGTVRRVELMWFGQAQDPGWAESVMIAPQSQVAAVLRPAQPGR
ncbi:NAD-dependent epimerase/dehydratase family protein [Paenarthrobacter sp. Z7-10]|uniref:NAD-dependent epimerase/dehydratase family protein n=1 Tax=Paenarthrobacter sp. Z7-10 TaxID=2787635 RepID=UPI0022A97DD7|nr:NAD-dependent epimerase/dehydratase family protein [Paenarthrobacter sp. Z7-10]